MSLYFTLYVKHFSCPSQNLHVFLEHEDAQFSSVGLVVLFSHWCITVCWCGSLWMFWEDWDPLSSHVNMWLTLWFSHRAPFLAALTSACHGDDRMAVMKCKGDITVLSGLCSGSQAEEVLFPPGKWELELCLCLQDTKSFCCRRWRGVEGDWTVWWPLRLYPAQRGECSLHRHPVQGGSFF